MRFNLISGMNMEIQDILMWQYLRNIVVNNRGKVVKQSIRVPRSILRLPCGCVRNEDGDSWLLLLVDEKGTPLPFGQLLHFAVNDRNTCDKLIAIPDEILDPSAMVKDDFHEPRKAEFVVKKKECLSMCEPLRDPLRELQESSTSDKQNNGDAPQINRRVSIERPESPYHAQPEHLDPLPRPISWPDPRR